MQNNYNNRYGDSNWRSGLFITPNTRMPVLFNGSRSAPLLSYESGFHDGQQQSHPLRVNYGSRDEARYPRNYDTKQLSCFRMPVLHNYDNNQQKDAYIGLHSAKLSLASEVATVIKGRNSITKKVITDILMEDTSLESEIYHKNPSCLTLMLPHTHSSDYFSVIKDEITSVKRKFEEVEERCTPYKVIKLTKQISVDNLEGKSNNSQYICDFCSFQVSCISSSDIKLHLQQNNHSHASLVQVSSDNELVHLLDYCCTSDKHLSFFDSTSPEMVVICPRCSLIFENKFLCGMHFNICHVGARPSFSFAKIRESSFLPLTINANNKFVCRKCAVEKESLRLLNLHYERSKSCNPYPVQKVGERLLFFCNVCKATWSLNMMLLVNHVSLCSSKNGKRTEDVGIYIHCIDTSANDVQYFPGEFFSQPLCRVKLTAAIKRYANSQLGSHHAMFLKP